MTESDFFQSPAGVEVVITFDLTYWNPMTAALLAGRENDGACVEPRPGDGRTEPPSEN